VLRFEVPLVCGLQFICTHTLDGGVTTSLALDAHGKSLSSRLLGMRIPARTDRSPVAGSSPFAGSVRIFPG
jgi:hypothetical protein